MDTSRHNLSTLFEQLGMSGKAEDIRDFIDDNKPLADSVNLADAPFWNKSQSEFIRCAWEEDADWAEPIDELDAQLRH